MEEERKRQIQMEKKRDLNLSKRKGLRIFYLNSPVAIKLKEEANAA
jgi:hypothetical protein